MEKDIVVVTDHIEIHPPVDGGKYTVVRDGAVYGVYATSPRRNRLRMGWRRAKRADAVDRQEQLKRELEEDTRT